MGYVRGAHVRVTQQKGAAAQEVHQDRCTVRAQQSGVFLQKEMLVILFILYYFAFNRYIFGCDCFFF